MGTKTDSLRTHAKQIDHSFYAGGLYPVGTMIMKDPHEIERRFQNGGLPAVGCSSDHVYVCVEYSMNMKTGNAQRKLHRFNNKLPEYNKLAEEEYDSTKHAQQPQTPLYKDGLGEWINNTRYNKFKQAARLAKAQRSKKVCSRW